MIYQNLTSMLTKILQKLGHIFDFHAWSLQ